MNRSPDVELVLRDYFADDGLTAPDHVLDVVAARISRQPQRRSWPFARRTTSMHQFKLIAGVAAALIVGIIGWQLAATPPGPGVTPSAAPSLPSTASPTLPAAAWWLWQQTDDGVVAVDDCGDAPEPPGCAGELAAGTHASSGFQPTITYVVPKGWVNGRDWANDFSLFPDTSFTRSQFPLGGRPAAEIKVQRVDLAGLMCPKPPATPPEPPVGSTPSEIVDHIIATQPFDGGVRNRTPVTIGGLDGEQIELAGRPGWTCDTRPAGGSGPFSTRLFVLTLPGSSGHLAIEIQKAPFAGVDVDFDQFVRDAIPVVASFRFEEAE